jgi:hypothetical protein
VSAPQGFDLNELATKTFEGSLTYADVVHFVHIYVVEPHPMSPDPSPYSGQVWEAGYSTLGQPKTYTGRVSNAQQMEPVLEGTQFILVDGLTPEAYNNPVWCTYGPCPNCSYLIGQDGIIVDTQRWVDPSDVERAIDNLIR